MGLQNKDFNEGNMSFRDGILNIKYNPDTVITENLLYKQFLFRKKIAQEQDIFIIVDLSEDINVTDEAITFVANHLSPDYIKALALVTKSGIDFVRARLYTIFDKPNINTKVFLTEEEARLWFKSLEQNNFIGKAC